MAMSNKGSRPEPFRVRSLAATVYGPNLLFAIGQGAASPIITLLALDLGASPAIAGAIVALRGIGTMLFNVPAGFLVARVGDRRAMSVAAALLGVTALAIGMGPSLPLYAALVFIMGCVRAVWTLARLSFVTESAPIGHRGRVMSLIGGTIRVGEFIGPLIGGIAVIPFGLAGPFFVQAAFASGAAFSLVRAPAGPSPSSSRRTPSGSMWQIALDNRTTLATVGFVAIAVQIMRSSRQAVIPLWGDAIGLDASQVSLIFGLSAAFEMVIFYPVGMLMDRRGRKWAAIPCLALCALGMALIPFTFGFTGLFVVGLLLGLANGLGSGINGTLGSDFSPVAGRSQFLGLWRLVSDLGSAGGPLLVAIATSVVSLGAASGVVAIFGLAGAVVMWKVVPESLNETRETLS